MAPPQRPGQLPDDDAELRELFAREPELLEVSRRLRASRPEPVEGAHFRTYLRAKLMDAAAAELGAGRRRPERGRRLAWRPRSGWFALGGAGLGMAMVAATVAAILVRPIHDVVPAGFSDISGVANVDPAQVIRVSFNQEMDRTAVVRGIQIQPALQFSTNWDGNTLVITPVHHLAANTPYTVRIQRDAIRDAGGQTASHPLVIPFGTAPTPSATPVPTPLQPVVMNGSPISPILPGSPIAYAPDGSVVLGAAVTSNPPSPSPTPSSPAGVLPSLLPSVSVPGVLSTTPVPTVTPSTTSGLVRIPTDGSTAILLGPPATALSYAPNGRLLAVLRPDGSGASLWVASAADGSGAARLAHTDDPSSPLGWAGNDTVLYVAGGQIRAASLQGQSRVLGHSPQVTQEQAVAFAPGGGVAFVGPAPAPPPTPTPSATPGTAPTSPSPSAAASSSSATTPATPTPTPAPPAGSLVDLGSGAAVPLSGSSNGAPAFSDDGATVVWVDRGGAAPQVMSAPAATGAGKALPGAGITAGDSIDGLTVSHDGQLVAFVVHHASGGAELRVVSLATGDLLATSDGSPATPAWSPDSTHLVWTTGSAASAQAVRAEVPHPQQAQPTLNPAATSAASTDAESFLAAQAAGDLAALQGLAPGLDLSGLLPQNALGLLSRDVLGRAPLRHYLLQVTRTASDSFTAQARLVRDPTGTQPTAFANETLTLTRQGQGYSVSSVDPGRLAFQAVPPGPQIVHVGAERHGRDMTARIAFDSDLDPSTVVPAVHTVDATGSPVTATVTYEPDTRTVVVVFTGSEHGADSVTVDTTLLDVNGQSLRQAYRTSVTG